MIDGLRYYSQSSIRLFQFCIPFQIDGSGEGLEGGMHQMIINVVVELYKSSPLVRGEGYMPGW